MKPTDVSRATRRRAEKKIQNGQEIVTRQELLEIMDIALARFHSEHVVELQRWYIWKHTPWYKRLWARLTYRFRKDAADAEV